MIRRFFLQLLVVTIIVCFFGLNFENKVDIRFWFGDKFNLTDVSLFVALAITYLLGFFTSIPFYIARGFKSKKNSTNKTKIKEKEKPIIKDEN